MWVLMQDEGVYLSPELRDGRGHGLQGEKTRRDTNEAHMCCHFMFALSERKDFFNRKKFFLVKTHLWSQILSFSSR